MEILALRRSVRAVVAGRLDRIPFAAPVDHLQVGAVEIVGLEVDGLFCKGQGSHLPAVLSPRQGRVAAVLIDFSAGQEDAGQIAAGLFGVEIRKDGLQAQHAFCAGKGFVIRLIKGDAPLFQKLLLQRFRLRFRLRRRSGRRAAGGRCGAACIGRRLRRLRPAGAADKQQPHRQQKRQQPPAEASLFGILNQIGLFVHSLSS